MKTKPRGKRKKKSKPKIHKPVTEIRDERKTKLKTGNKLISAVHNLNKVQKLIDKDPTLTQKEKTRKIEHLQSQINEIGGINAYQSASLSGERHHGNFNSAQWVIRTLTEQQIIPPQDGALKLLDVGALDTVYQRHGKWFDWTAIDLNPQKPQIQKADFLQFRLDCRDEYDVIVLSLVLNFSGDPIDRGKMLHQARRLTKLNGHVIVVLPLACLSNSRYLTHDLFKSMMESLGFDTITEHNSKKLAFKMFKKARKSATVRIAFNKKEISKGGARNNFCIILR